MKKTIVSVLSVLGFAALCAAPAYADDLESLAGKWSTQKTNEDGQRYTQTMEIKKNKFIFKIADNDGTTRLYAEGDVKLDKAGPFKTVNFINIKAGQSADATDSIEDTYTSIYKMQDDGSWLVVMNFDKERDSQKPSLDVYRKAKAAQK